MSLCWKGGVMELVKGSAVDADGQVCKGVLCMYVCVMGEGAIGFHP